MGGLVRISLGDLVRVAARYRPVALTVAAIVVIAFAVPGRPDPTPRPALAAPASAGPSPASPPTSLPATLVPTTATPPALPRPTPAGPVVSAPSPSLGRPSTPGSPTSTTPLDEPPRPLTLRASAWATQAAGTPVATVGVPEGTLPVGTRLGQVDKASFIRLDGTATTLELVEDPGGRRSGVGEASVKACAIDAADADWAEAEAMSFDDAPTWDANACVEGVPGDDGTWSFDLGSFVSRTDAAGFALVPTADAPLDFQVTFSRR